PVSFFFQCSLAPRYLPSFPTRRSSDLSEVLCTVDLSGFTRCGTLLSIPPFRLGACLRLCHLLAPKPPYPPQFLPPLHSVSRTPADRKSTRLNSSHVKISYAVFCLKKKT